MHSDVAARCWRLSRALRISAPLVHNITNLVVQNDTADAIAAVGGTQMTVHIPDEAAEAATCAAALAINIGTPDAPWLQAARTAVQTAAARAIPWVLDPLAAGFTDYRRAIAEDFLARRPTVIKANASEILALTRGVPAGRAGDSLHDVEEAAQAAQTLAHRRGCTVVISGREDLITDGERQMRLANGTPLLGAMIGSGCLLTAVIGCYLAVAEDPFEAAVAAVAHFTIAGEIAAEGAGGPGTLKPLLIDALYGLDLETLRGRLRHRA